jgi:hypothetical protein
VQRRRVVLVDARCRLERARDLDLGFAEDDSGALLPRGLGLARHGFLQLARNDDVAHLHRLHRDAPRRRSLVNQSLQLLLDLLASAQKVCERRTTDDVAQRRLRRPAHRLGIVLHLEGCLLGVVDDPEQHGVDVDRHGVGRRRLLCRKTTLNCIMAMLL